MIEKKMNLSGQWSWQWAHGGCHWSTVDNFSSSAPDHNSIGLDVRVVLSICIGFMDFWDGGQLLSFFIIADIFTKFSLNILIALLMFITDITYRSTCNIYFFFWSAGTLLSTSSPLQHDIYVYFYNSQSHSNNNKYDKFQDWNTNIPPQNNIFMTPKIKDSFWVPTLTSLLKIASSFMLTRRQRIFFHLCSIVRWLVILFILSFVIWISFKRIRKFCYSHQMYKGTQSTREIIILLISVGSGK